MSELGEVKLCSLRVQRVDLTSTTHFTLFLWKRTKQLFFSPKPLFSISLSFLRGCGRAGLTTITPEPHQPVVGLCRHCWCHPKHFGAQRSPVASGGWEWCLRVGGGTSIFLLHRDSLPPCFVVITYRCPVYMMMRMYRLQAGHYVLVSVFALEEKWTLSPLSLLHATPLCFSIRKICFIIYLFIQSLPLQHLCCSPC